MKHLVLRLLRLQTPLLLIRKFVKTITYRMKMRGSRFAVVCVRMEHWKVGRLALYKDVCANYGILDMGLWMIVSAPTNASLVKHE